MGVAEHILLACYPKPTSGEEPLTHSMQRNAEGDVRNLSMSLFDDMSKASWAATPKYNLAVKDVLSLQLRYSLDITTLTKFADKHVPGFSKRLEQATMGVLSFAEGYRPSSSNFSSSSTSSSSSSSSHFPSSSASDPPADQPSLNFILIGKPARSFEDRIVSAYPKIPHTCSIIHQTHICKRKAYEGMEEGEKENKAMTPTEDAKARFDRWNAAVRDYFLASGLPN